MGQLTARGEMLFAGITPPDEPAPVSAEQTAADDAEKPAGSDTPVSDPAGTPETAEDTAAVERETREEA